MPLYEAFTILITLSCCFYAGYTDIKFRKVRNFCSLGLIGLGLCNQGLLILIGESSITEAIFLVLGGFLVSYLIYLVGIWAPGDSKLFFGVALVLPRTAFKHFVGIGAFPILGLLINIFLLYFLFAIVSILYKGLKGDLKVNLQPEQVLNDIVMMIYNLFCFIGLLSLILYPIKRLNIEINRFLIVFGFMGFFFLLRRFIAKLRLESYYALLLAPFLFVTIFFVSPSLTALIHIAILSTVAYFLFRMLVEDFGQTSFIEERDISELKPGVILAERIIEVEEKKYEKSAGIFSSHFTKGVLVGPTPEGLSSQQIEELIRLSNHGYFKTFENKIKIQHSVVFAPFIALGTLMTVIFSGAIYRFLF